jgi:hypothetical protein
MHIDLRLPYGEIPVDYGRWAANIAEALKLARAPAKDGRVNNRPEQGVFSDGDSLSD